MTMKFFLLSIFLFFSLNSQADVHVEDLQLRFKISSLMIQAKEEILETFKHENLIDVESAVFKDKWERKVRSLSENLVLEQLKMAKAKPSHISKARDILSLLEWKKISSFTLKQVKNLKVLGRLNGLGLVMFCVFTNVAQFIVPTILTSAGYPVLALISVAATGNVPTIMYHKGITYFGKLRRSYKNFNGAKNYKRYTRIIKEVRKNLAGSDLNDLILPLENMSKFEGVIIKSEGIVRKSLMRLGFLKNSISSMSLKTFLDDEEIMDPVLRSIMNNKSLSSELRVALALNYMDANLDGSTLLKYKTKFQSSFAKIHSSGHEQLALDWVKLVLKSRTSSDFDQAFKSLSLKLHPTEVFLLWEQIVLPHFSKDSKNISYVQFRNLVEGANALKADIFLNERTSMSPTNKEIFSKYFFNALKTRGRKCFKSHDQILHSLLSF